MEDKAQRKFIDFIQSRTKRPAMYGAGRVEDIWIMAFAYLHALSDEDKEPISKTLSEFREFVNKHFKTKSDYSWERLIRFHSGGDLHSIELFSSLFNEFLKKHKG